MKPNSPPVTFEHMASSFKAAIDRPCRRWPRFTLRSLVIVVTLFCLYFGCWEATRTWGVPDLASAVGGTQTAIIPFVIRSDWIDVDEVDSSKTYYRVKVRYDIWAFGATFTLRETERRVFVLGRMTKSSPQSRTALARSGCKEMVPLTTGTLAYLIDMDA